ncbi:hypothetical protein ZHAS_00009436 [Anopheles sinensis]|uniref:KH domain-containing protein n=1 Tax=Anopheles sinensis TaxID=74873 RepID=A0A084VUY6_ANOSI|nr:hypothetical protein ZHAS_00009436 [Anopheles sinensis]
MDNMMKNSMGLHDDRSSRNSNSSSSGSPTVVHEKKKMLDITRDRPIKIAVRVQVPVRDHPKFNFVGKLLGPKGNSLKRLQEETMCKMAVLGKGSMRDRKKEEELRLSGDPRYAHLSEDLHVEISTYTAPAEAHARIAYALAEVRRFLVPVREPSSVHNVTHWPVGLARRDGLRRVSSQSCSRHVSVTRSVSSTEHVVKCVNRGTMSSQTPTSRKLGKIYAFPYPHSSPDTPSISFGAGIYAATVSRGYDSVSVQSLSRHSQIGRTSTQRSPTANPAQNEDLRGPLDARYNVIIRLNGAANQFLTGDTDMSSLLQPMDVNMASANHFVNSLPTSDLEAQTLAFVESANAFLHPALRGVKAVSLARKRPLLGGPRSTMNPTKRTVMTLIARARTAQALHGSRTAQPIGEPIQVITSPLILQPSLDLLQPNAGSGVAKENILQGA